MSGVTIADATTIAAEAVGLFIGAVAIGVTAILYIRSKFKNGVQQQDNQLSNEAITSLQATVGALETQNTLQADELIKQAKLLSELNGKVSTLQDIPLAKIEQHMADTNRILQALLPLIPQSIEQTITKTSRTKLK
jgi:predicted PurR-regulated permease PerM